MQNSRRCDFLKKNNAEFILVSTIALSCILFISSYFLGDAFSKLFNLARYLTWHNVLEICGTIVCFAVFLVSYYTYDRTKSLRAILLGSFLLCVGLLEIFHTLSFKGMPEFLIVNLEANRATTLWIISRLVSAAGFLSISFISLERKSSLYKNIFVLFAIIIAISALIITTYFSGLIPEMYIEGTGLTPIKKILEVFVAMLFFITIIRLYRGYLKTCDKLLLIFCTALTLNIFSELAFICYNQVYDIFNYIGHIYKAVSYIFVFQVMFVRNVLQPYVDLSAAQQELRHYVENLDRIVEQRTRQLKHMNRKLMDDLEYARDIQKSMLPSVLPDVKGISFSTFYYPAERLGGDFYDIYRINDRYVGMYICDVSGHGVPAAMLTVFLKQCIENRLEADMINGKISLPSEMLQSIYDSFNNTNFKDEVYIVLIYAIYDTNASEMTYGSAGMNAAPIIIKKDGSVEEVYIHGLPICKFKGVFEVCYNDSTIRFDKGDKILFYTDGLVEAENKTGEQFSAGNLITILKENSKENGSRLFSLIQDKLFAFIDGWRIKDDITFYIMDVDE